MTEKEAEEYAKLTPREAVRHPLPADDINGQRMAAEIFGKLPADHPDSPYADEARVMQRDNPE